MLKRGPERWDEPVRAEEAAGFFHKYLTDKEYRRRIDFSDKESLKLWEWNEKTAKGVAKLIADMPMSKWANAKGSSTKFADGIFSLAFDIIQEDKAVLHRWSLEIVLYRLHVHFERRTERENQ
ncbi:hypothetical protein J2Z22_004849 [Paenibacillus forsythiae]|uniref:Uncharacterized protein n=1 Tax=Paenibacillus forsythiae TaxID=365616 RepID=A0ABU3HEL7_9BACL|nr:hypothetical protein [Paenibacillus forsythiae]MDT3429248.1 hypothetical protein [Paenibacillus forsythiae]